jgi:T5SS/PEP-CTERM-associated repeat protein
VQGGTVEAGNAAYGDTEGALVLGWRNGGTDGSGVVTVDGTASVIRSDGLIWVGEAGTGSMTIGAGGTVAVTGTLVNGYGAVVVGDQSGSTGTITVTGAGSLLNAGAGRLSLGPDGTGALVVSQDGTVMASAAGYMDDEPAFRLGVDAGGAGSATIDGVGSTLTANGAVSVGQDGTGTVIVSNGGALSAGGANDGGTGLTIAEGTGTGTVDVHGGTLAVSDNAAIGAGGAVTLESGGVLSIGGSLTVAARGILDIAGGTLDLATANLGGGAISGFAAGSEIVIADAIGATDSISGGDVTTLDLFSGVTGIGSLDFAGTPNLSFDSATGTVTVACFAAGTRIATGRGDVPVEALTVGDLVRVGRRGGGVRPVVWLGHRRVDCRLHPRPDSVWPVRVAAGAFGAGRPVRALVLSPDHAVFTGGVLIPVRYLVNGTTIVQEQWDRATYWHVELDRHDVLLAEGLPCESFLDTGQRAAFANGGTVANLHPDFSRRVWEADGCAPLVVAGPRLERVRAKLRAPARAA